MGRRRNTAKTGDKALYKKRDNATEESRSAKDYDDPTFDEVDRFHNQRDQEFLKFSREGDDDEESQDEIDRTEAVMDLGLGGDSSSEDDSSDDESAVDNDQAHGRLGPMHAGASDDDEEQVSLSDDDTDNEPALRTSVRDWGRQKKDYYHGDTADLELGQEEDDAFVEEQAAKEIQAARYEQMEEEDFVVSDDEEHDEAKTEEPDIDKPSKDVSKLSRSEKAKLLDRQHPELLALVGHFSKILREWKEKTNVVTSILMQGEGGTAESVGATKLGQQYLINKAMLEASAGLNLATYLLLKSEQPSSDNDLDPAWIQSHPVMKHLHKINTLMHMLEEQVEDRVPGLTEQMDKLTKASELLAHGEVDLENEELDSDGDEDAQNESDNANDVAESDLEQPRIKEKEAASSDESSDNGEDSDKEHFDEQTRARMVANEARFGLRQAEVSTAANSSKIRQKALLSDFGDSEHAETEQVGKSLAATLNSIEQRSAVRKRKVVQMADSIDYEAEDSRIRRGLAMTEEELGPASDKDGAEDDAGSFDPEREEDDFYSQMTKKSKRKKEVKKNLYAVQPKYPRIAEEIEGERAISRTILKNRGLVPHKSKINRNPRVKKREQYRKALIRRKGAVREVRKDESHKYAGEATGINMVSRSRRFGS